MSDGRDDEGPIEVPVEALAGALGDEQAPVAGGAFEPSRKLSEGSFSGEWPAQTGSFEQRAPMSKAS